MIFSDFTEIIDQFTFVFLDKEVGAHFWCEVILIFDLLGLLRNFE